MGVACGKSGMPELGMFPPWLVLVLAVPDSCGVWGIDFGASSILLPASQTVLRELEGLILEKRRLRWHILAPCNSLEEGWSQEGSGSAPR